jgi:hypothetical protein
MTAEDLKDVFLSTEFKNDLNELSSYLASIMQERPIVYLLAKHLWKRGIKYELEEKRCDLTVNGKRCEFKCNLIRAMAKLKEELTRWQSLDDMCAAVKRRESSRTWTIMPRIYEDVCEKSPDFFVWIIYSRDLANVSETDLARICFGKELQKFNKKHPYETQGKLLDAADTFLQRLCEKRPFVVLKGEIVTNGDFPSTYFFRICDFAQSR